MLVSRSGGYAEGTPRHGWDHAEPCLPHAISSRWDSVGRHPLRAARRYHGAVLVTEHQHRLAGHLGRVLPATNPEAVHHLQAEPVLKQAEPRLAERELR